MRSKTAPLAIALALASVSPGNSQGLLGDWGGLRERLASRGLQVEAVVTADVLRTRGGLRGGDSALGNLDITLELDTETSGAWPGGRAFVYLLGNTGTGPPPSALLGDLQVTSHIEAPHTLKLYEAWLEQRLPGGAGSVLLGLHDYNGEFEVIEEGALFLHSSFGITPDVSQVGPSIFPTTALGLLLRLEPRPGLTVQAATYDGVPGHGDDAGGTQVSLSKADGLFHAAEVGVLPARGVLSRIVAGGWYRTTDFEDEGGVRRRNNGGGYVLVEAAAPVSRKGRRLGAFLQVGRTRPDRNAVGAYAGAGVTLSGLVPGRPGDVMGLGVAHARLTGALWRREAGLPGAETAIELTYSTQLLPGLRLQPDIQLVLDPASAGGISDGLQVGMRLELTL